MLLASADGLDFSDINIGQRLLVLSFWLSLLGVLGDIDLLGNMQVLLLSRSALSILGASEGIEARIFSQHEGMEAAAGDVSDLSMREALYNFRSLLELVISVSALAFVELS